MNSIKTYVLFFHLISALVTTAFAECDPYHATLDCAANPNPSTDDFILPMPGNLQMVFKKVVVPGKEFWGNEQRLVKIGNIRGAEKEGTVPDEKEMFESVLTLPISGSFYDFDKKHWFYYLGKYEVSFGQFVMVMGKGNLEEGLQKLREAVGDYQAGGDEKPFGKLLEDTKTNSEQFWALLARPLTAVSWLTIQTFIHAYNQWCYETPDCAEKLPRLPKQLESKKPTYDDSPGFLRLPSELEWEYATRGGYEALTQNDKDGRPLFEHDLPIAETEPLKKVAWIKPESEGRARMIGQLQPTYGGFHDLLGNVAELTANLFTAEGIQGKVGSLTLRGGAFNSEETDMRVSKRSELAIYRYSERLHKMVETRHESVGIRLTIGSLVIVDNRLPLYKEVQEEYARYQTGVREVTVAATSNKDDLFKANRTLQTAKEDLEQENRQLENRLSELRESFATKGAEWASTTALIDHLQKSNQQLKSQMDTALNEARKQIEQGTLNVCEKQISNAVLLAKTAGWNYARALGHAKMIDTLNQMTTLPGKREKLNLAQKNYRELLQAFDNHFANYAQTVETLGGYDSKWVSLAMANYRRQTRDNLLLAFLKLLEKHATSAKSGKVNVKLWKGDIQSQKGLFD